VACHEKPQVLVSRFDPFRVFFFAGAVAGAEALHEVVNDGHKELKERGRGKGEEMGGREAEVVPAASSRQTHLVLLFCIDSF